MVDPNISAVKFRQKVQKWVFKNPASFSFGEKYIRNNQADFILYRQSAGELPRLVLKLRKISPSSKVQQIETVEADMITQHQDIQPTVLGEMAYSVEQIINVPAVSIMCSIQDSNSQTWPIAGTNLRTSVAVIDTAEKIDQELEAKHERPVADIQSLGSVSESIDLQPLARSNIDRACDQIERVGTRENVDICLSQEVCDVLQPVDTQEICFAKEQEAVTLVVNKLLTTVSEGPLETVIEEDFDLTQAVSLEESTCKLMPPIASKFELHEVEDIEQGLNKSGFPCQELNDEIRLTLTLVCKSEDQWTTTNRKRKWPQVLAGGKLTNKKVFTYPEAGLEIRDIPMQGISVFTTKRFLENEIVIVYSGEGFDLDEEYKKKQPYRYECKEGERGDFMFKLQFHSKMVWIDAADPKYGIARLINHGYPSNLRGGVIQVDKKPRFYFKAARNIEIGEELVYDYSDRR